MKSNQQKSVMIERYRPSLDWFEIKAIEVPLDQGFHFELQFRLGSWFLMFFKWDEKQSRLVSEYHNDFELSRPHEAVLKLGNKIRAFTRLHGCDMSEPLFKLMKRVESEKERQRTKGA